MGCSQKVNCLSVVRPPTFHSIIGDRPQGAALLAIIVEVRRRIGFGRIAIQEEEKNSEAEWRSSRHGPDCPAKAVDTFSQSSPRRGDSCTVLSGKSPSI